jgi:hypothetical protein
VPASANPSKNDLSHSPSLIESAIGGVSDHAVSLFQALGTIVHHFAGRPILDQESARDQFQRPKLSRGICFCHLLQLSANVLKVKTGCIILYRVRPSAVEGEGP